MYCIFCYVSISKCVCVCACLHSALVCISIYVHTYVIYIVSCVLILYGSSHFLKLCHYLIHLSISYDSYDTPKIWQHGAAVAALWDMSTAFDDLLVLAKASLSTSESVNGKSPNWQEWHSLEHPLLYKYGDSVLLLGWHSLIQDVAVWLH